MTLVDALQHILRDNRDHMLDTVGQNTYPQYERNLPTGYRMASILDDQLRKDFYRDLN